MALIKNIKDWKSNYHIKKILLNTEFKILDKKKLQEKILILNKD